MRKQLTEKLCERIRPPAAGRVEYWDATIPGLLLRVSDKGRKSWNVHYYKPGTATKRRRTLGTYPLMNLSKAREAAGKYLAKVEKGEDPYELEKQHRKAPALNTVAAALEEFDKRHLQALKGGKKAKATLDAELVKRYGDTRLDALKRYHLQNMLDEIVDRGAPVQANRVLAWTRRFLNWCVARELVEFNVSQGIERPAEERPRDRVLADDELRAVWSAADKDGGTFGDLIKVLILTGQRLNEVAKMRWEDLDLDNALWTLSSSQTKAERVHEVPISPAALEIIEKRPRVEKNPFVFAGRGKVAINGFSKPKAHLDALIGERAKKKEAPKVGPWTIHDLRRTAATNLARLGFSDEVIGAVLNHAPRGVTSRVYAHYRSLPKKKDALDTWAKRVGAINEGNADKVVPLMAASA